MNIDESTNVSNENLDLSDDKIEDNASLESIKSLEEVESAESDPSSEQIKEDDHPVEEETNEEIKQNDNSIDDLGLEEVSDAEQPSHDLSDFTTPEKPCENGEITDNIDDGLSKDNQNENFNKTEADAVKTKLFENLEMLETETISDNEELSFADDENIEEGEIPAERKIPTPKPAEKRDNGISKTIIAMELNSNCVQDGEYEEGEIIEENTTLEITEPVVEEEPAQNETEEVKETEESVQPIELELESELRISKNLSLFRKSSRNVMEHNYRGRSEEENASFRHSSISKESEVDLDFKNKHRDRHKHISNKRLDDRKKNKRIDSRYDSFKKVKKKERQRMEKDEYGRDVSLRRMIRSRKYDSGSHARRRSRSYSRKSRKRKFSRSRSRSRRKRKIRRRSYSSSSFTSRMSSRSRSRSRSSSKSSFYRGKSKKRHKKSKVDSRSKKRRSRLKRKDSDDETYSKVVSAFEKRVDDKIDGSSRKKDTSNHTENTQTEKKKKSKSNSHLSKEVFQTGGNIMVSVNFPRHLQKNKEVNESTAKDPKPAVTLTPPEYDWPRNETASSPNGQHTPLQDEPMWSPRRNLSARNEPADDIILVTPPTPDPITISDSDEEHRAHKLQQNASRLARIHGPKTPPPPPGVRFSVIPKQQQLKSSSNPLFDAGDEEFRHSAQNNSNEDGNPALPPPPKWSPRTSPNGQKVQNPTQNNDPASYDPFQPTKSPSPGAMSPNVNNQSSNSIDKENESSVREKQDSYASDMVLNLQFQQKNSEISRSNHSLASNDNFMNINKPNTVPENMILSPIKMNYPHEQIKPINYASLTTNAPNLEAHERRRSASTSENDAINRDTGSPVSPASSDLSDFFEPPSPTKNSKPFRDNNQPKIPMSKPKPNDKTNKFDNLFSNAKPVKPNPVGPKVMGKQNKPPQPPAAKKKPSINDDDYIPRSAVDLQKAQRQERIAEEVKITLKPFFNKKIINKDEYKDIMRKSVMKVCQSKSGEINPAKIRLLVDAYIKKVRYLNKHKPPPSSNPPPNNNPFLPSFHPNLSNPN